MNQTRWIVVLPPGLALVLSLGACSYDYLQHSDRVGYHSGDAVRANLASSVVNPTKNSMYDKTGLGKDGDVVPDEPVSATTP